MDIGAAADARSAPAWNRLLASRVGGIAGSPIDDSISLLQQQIHPVISFAMGSPARDALPLAPLRAIAEDIFESGMADALGYGPTEGEASLRAALLAWLGTLGSPVGKEELLITAGGTQGLDLVCKLFVGPGDLVAVEDPTYPNGMAIITGYEGRLLRCPTDEEGLRIDRLRELAQREGRPKLIYVIPSFQNPGGCTLSAARRRELLALAEGWDALILEDDPYGQLHFGAPPPPSLWLMGRASGRVIAVNTFSKILAAGLRVGWVQAPAPIIHKMIAAKQGLDTCANVLGQRLIAGFLGRGLLAPHLASLRALYQARRDAMLASLDHHFGTLPGVGWQRPAGGFFLWLRLPPGLSAEKLFPLALEEGVAFVPGSAFQGPGAAGNSLRLCFAHPDPLAIEDGVGRLRRAIDRLQGR
jgi:2-aminoadipate transaminase